MREDYIELNEEVKDEDVVPELILQWAVIFVGLVLVIIFGSYGPGYDPADFVYMQF